MRPTERDSPLLAVLEAVAGAGAPLSVRALAARAGLSRSAAHRAAVVLERRGLVARAPGGLVAGLRLFELGQRAPAPGDLRDAARPVMQDLLTATGHVVALAVLDGTETVWIEQLAGRAAPPVPSRIGHRLPAHVTAAGKALLAHAPPELVAAAPLTARTPATLTDPAALAAELAEVRRTGIARNREEATVGVLGVAAPVLRPDGTAAAALGLAIPRRAHLGPERTAPAVRTAALTLARALTAQKGTVPSWP